MAGFSIENFGCRAARADGEAIAGRLRAAGRGASRCVEAVRCRQYLQRNGRSRPRCARLYPPRAPQESRGQNRRHRLLRATRASGTGRACPASPPSLATATRPSRRRSSSTWRTARHTPTAFRPRLVPVPRSSARATAHSAPIWADDRFAHSFIEDLPQLTPGAQTRPNLKIQEGCGNRCTFCVIPLTRGPSKSLPHAVVLRHVEEFVAAGGKELVLSGINLGRWGRDFLFRHAVRFARKVWSAKSSLTPRCLASG